MTPWAVVLAGGVGSRFWPISTRTQPKQLLPLATDAPLLVDALTRVAGKCQNAGDRLEADEKAGVLLALAVDQPKTRPRTLLPVAA